MNRTLLRSVWDGASNRLPERAGTPPSQRFLE
jgi:hypothetical protein